MLCRLNAEPPVWHPYLDRLSLAIVEMLLSEWVLSGDRADNRALDDEALHVLESTFVRLPIPDCPMWTDSAPGGPKSRWFAGFGAILREDAATWLWVRARSERALATIRDVMPGGWLMQPD